MDTAADNGQADRALAAVAADYLDDHLQRHPEAATGLGEHRYDGRLTDISAAALADERQALDRFAARLAAVDAAALTPGYAADAQVVAGAIELRVFQLDELREHTWNPLLANPGRAIYKLLARDFAPLPDRLAAVAGRLAAIPAMLDAARRQLGPMPRVHAETAISQFGGTITLITDTVDAALAAAPASAAAIDRARPAALAALEDHRAWLSARLADGSPAGDGPAGDGPAGDGPAGGGGAGAEPRIGEALFARKLSLTLSAAADADAIQARAHADLDRVSDEIAALAARMAGPAAAGSPAERVRLVLDRLAQDAADDRTVLALGRDALAATTAFVRETDLITLYDDPVEVIEMPELDRGVAVAYCDSPGPLETTPMPTFLAMSPAPAGWTPEQVASFYREYNQHLMHDLIVHEAMPGHYAQLGHSRRFTGPGTAIRSVLTSGALAEGWAVYAEKIMADAGYPGRGDPRAVRMQQLKMQLRMIINAILDGRVHARGMTRPQAMELMTGRGYQEEGEAAGKWRRALLTSAQLSTYYVGYTEVSDLAAELLAGGGTPRAVHDRMLAHGSPPPRLLRGLLGAPG